MKSNFRTIALTATALAMGSVLIGAPEQASAAGKKAAAAFDHRAEAREIYARVVGVKSVAGEGQVPVVASYLEERFKQAGFPQSDLHVLPLGETVTLVVRYRGDGSSGKKPILLIAHMDVVGARPEDWTKDPFKLIEEDGYFYGRGTNDNKAGVAALATAFLRFKAEGFVPNRDLIIAFTGDEETTLGTAHMLATQHRELIDAEFALNTDAGYGAFDTSGRNLGFAFQTAEKTSMTYEMTVRNIGGHSARPRPDNAIYQLAAALQKVGAYKFEPLVTETTSAYFAEVSKQYSGEVAEAMRRFSRDSSDRAAADLIETQMGELGTTRTTCVATMLTGGHAFNALPQTATATINCRVFPGTSAEEVRSILTAVVNDPEVEIVATDVKTVAPGSPLRKDVLNAYTNAVRARFPGSPIIPRMLSGMTDGAEFRAVGIPTYGVDGTWVIVPDDLRLHGKDERMSVDAFYSNLDHWDRMLKELAGPGKRRR